MISWNDEGIPDITPELNNPQRASYKEVRAEGRGIAEQSEGDRARIAKRGTQVWSRRREPVGDQEERDGEGQCEDEQAKVGEREDVEEGLPRHIGLGA